MTALETLHPFKDELKWTKYLSFISEVTEAHSLASEGLGSDRGQNEKKILGKNSKIVSF